MGHIDHGKTSLLLAIRKLKASPGKPGGTITQHVGAYQAEHKGQDITFLDTPGHEAFSQMRKRGSKVADLAVLVVAADEGVRQQTKEAIAHIKEAKIPFVVAINKVDKAHSDPEKVKRELAKEDVLTESMGGKVPAVAVSATTGKGIDELLELILLVAEMEELKTDFEAQAKGVVIESYLEAKRGPTATLILSQGKLTTGQIIGTWSTFGKVRGLYDFTGQPILEGLPSQPTTVLGFESPPRVGEEVKVFASVEEARANIKSEQRRPLPAREEPSQKALNLILKADALGSLEAVEEVLKCLPQEQIALRILKAGVGEITESDSKLAKHSEATVLGFRVKVNAAAKALLQREKVKVLLFDVIYDLVEEVRKIMTKQLEPEVVKTVLGKMKVLVVFATEKTRQIVGGKVTEGLVKKGAFLGIARGAKELGSGKIINLQRNKKDVDVAQKGQEAGILYEGAVTIEVGDILTIYTEERRKGEL